MMKKRVLMGVVGLACFSFFGGFAGTRYILEARIIGQTKMPEPILDELPSAFEEVDLKHHRSARHTWDRSNSALSTAAGARDAEITNGRRIEQNSEIDADRVFASDAFSQLTEEAITIAIAQRDQDPEEDERESY